MPYTDDNVERKELKDAQPNTDMTLDPDDEREFGCEDVQPNKENMPALHKAHVEQRKTPQQKQQERQEQFYRRYEEEREKLQRIATANKEAAAAYQKEMYRILGNLIELRTSIDEQKGKKDVTPEQVDMLDTFYTEVDKAVQTYLQTLDNASFAHSLTETVDKAKSNPTLECKGVVMLNALIKLINKMLPQKHQIAEVETKQQKQFNIFVERFQTEKKESSEKAVSQQQKIEVAEEVNALRV